MKYSYKTYLGLWALLVGDKPEGEIPAYLPMMGYHRRRVKRVARGEFVKMLSAYEGAHNRKLTADNADLEYGAAWDEVDFRIDLFVAYWERMQAAGLVLGVAR